MIKSSYLLITTFINFSKDIILYFIRQLYAYFVVILVYCFDFLKIIKIRCGLLISYELFINYINCLLIISTLWIIYRPYE
jgi:hypothetical protein